MHRIFWKWLLSRISLNIESWTTAFVIYMDILLEKWPFRAREYLIYMQNIRLAASSCQNNGWLVYDEQYRLKKARFPFSSWGVIDQELWILCVTTSNLSNTMDANRNSRKEPFSENSRAHAYLSNYVIFNSTKLCILFRNNKSHWILSLICFWTPDS
jgi:hypothetical protein